MKRRPEAKGVLLALADRCDDDGRNSWPSVATIAAEAEVGTRIVDACLGTLRSHGLIVEQQPPRQHRPRTWRINIDVLAALAEAQHLATLNKDRPAASCDPEQAAHSASDPQISTSDPQERGSDPQIQNSDPQHVADDPVLLIRSSERSTEQDPAALAPRSVSDEENEKNYTFLKGYAFDVIAELGRTCEFAQLTARLATVAAKRDLPHNANQIGAAMLFALNARRFGVAV